MVPQDLVHICWICGNNVSLEESKTDEHGNAVHEECYIIRVSLQSASQTTVRPHLYPAKTENLWSTNRRSSE